MDTFPPYQTVHRHYQQWVAKGVFKKILQRLVEHLREKGKINLAETFIDASFVEAKKGVKKLAKPSRVRALKSWQSATISLFRSPYPLKVLHQLRLHLLKEQFGLGTPIFMNGLIVMYQLLNSRDGEMIGENIRKAHSRLDEVQLAVSARAPMQPPLRKKIILKNVSQASSDHEDFLIGKFTYGGALFSVGCQRLRVSSKPKPITPEEANSAFGSFAHLSPKNAELNSEETEM